MAKLSFPCFISSSLLSSYSPPYDAAPHPLSSCRITEGTQLLATYGILCIVHITNAISDQRPGPDRWGDFSFLLARSLAFLILCLPPPFITSGLPSWTAVFDWHALSTSESVNPVRISTCQSLPCGLGSSYEAPRTPAVYILVQILDNLIQQIVYLHLTKDPEAPLVLSCKLPAWLRNSRASLPLRSPERALP